jgi:large subunit ribosomal protein L10
MPRPEKVQAVADIKERIEGAQAVFLAEYAGLSVKDQQALRRELRANDAEFKVVKMTLARRAAGDLEIDSLDDLLLGPTGLAFADGDPVGAAKVLKDFAKGHDVFVIKGGLLGFDFLSPEKIAELADIEPREVLLAKIAGAMKAPMANLAGLLAALPRNTASVLQQLLEKKEAADDQPIADSSQPTAEAEAVADAEDSAPEADDDGDKADKTEDQTEANVEASDDADEETEDPADEASEDAEEE